MKKTKIVSLIKINDIIFSEKNNLDIDKLLKIYDNFSNFLLYGDVQSGKTKKLINFTNKLFDLSKINIIFYLTGSKNDILYQNQSRFFEFFESKRSDTYVYSINSLNSETIEFNINKGFKLIINSLKTSYRLKQVQALIEELPRFIQFLIIDDEGDEISLSLKSQQLFSLLTKKTNVKFLSITASPFANLYKNHDFYDFYLYLESAQNYQDVEKFEENYIVMDNNQWRESIILSFFLWVKTIIENSIENSQFLINIFSKTRKQEKIYNFLQSQIEFWTFEEILLKELKRIKRIYFSLSEIKQILKFIRSLSYKNIFLSNSKTDNEIKNKGHEIIIGGLKLSRGLTFKNLLTGIMLNMGKTINAGTLIQRARWLGFNNRKSIMKIIINENIYNAFQEIQDLMIWTKKYNFSSKNYKNVFKEKVYKYIKI